MRLEAFLASSEARFEDIKPGAEKRITWVGREGQRTRFSIIYLHGYSATRQETAPLTQRLASQLGANAYETRLRGHGRSDDAMLDGSVGSWLEDVREAYTIGKIIGQEVIVVAVSTGGTLATWLAAQPFADQIAGMILISPNFDIPDQRAYWLDWPLGIGVQLVEWVSGERHRWEPATQLHARYWTYEYPVAALQPMVRLLKLVQATDKQQISVPTLFIYSPRDQVVLPRAIVAAHDAYGSQHKQLIGYTRSADPSQHVLAGDILSPGSTDELVRYSLRFLRLAKVCNPCEPGQ